MTNTSTDFVKIETNLKKALVRVQLKLAVLSSRTDLPIEQQSRHRLFEFWNNLHDLEDRIKDRLWDNWNAAKDAHWGAYGFNAY